MTGGSAAAGGVVALRSWLVTQQQIDAYADVSDDHNPLHVDPVFAAQTRYGTTIAHGLLLVGVLSDALTAWIGPAWSNGGELDVKFVGAVRAGDTVAITAAPADPQRSTDGAVRLEIRCAVGESVALVGTAVHPVSR